MGTNLRLHKRIDVELAERSYSIRIGAGALLETDMLTGLARGHLAVIVTNSVVGPLYAERLRQRLTDLYDRVLTIELEDGEA